MHECWEFECQASVGLASLRLGEWTLFVAHCRGKIKIYKVDKMLT